jgi:hypothetical protein
VNGFYGQTTLLMPGGGMVLGGSRTPKIDRTLQSPHPDDGAFAKFIERGSTDVNGDGKADVVVRSDTRLWVLYGR